MPDIRIDDDKLLDMAAGLLVSARGRPVDQRHTLLDSALMLSREVANRVFIEHAGNLKRALDAHQRAEAENGGSAKPVTSESPAKLAAGARSAIAKRGWHTRRSAKLARSKGAAKRKLVVKSKKARR
jgi:hypothetical protein